MPEQPYALTILGFFVLAAPLSLLLLLGIASLLDRKLSEEATARAVEITVVSGLLSSITILVSMLALGTRHVAIELGDWVSIPHQFHFTLKFVFDRLSVPLVILTYVLTGTIGAFASRYMHRDRGYNRFFVHFTLFVAGMVITSLAGTIETLFAGWEMVGLSSALLVAFFQERPAPPRNGLWVWINYRVSDAALLLASVAMHHLRGEGDFDKLLGSGTWPEQHAYLPTHIVLLVGGLLLLAAAGKSAMVPFSGWLPRAMEGPTPSSAVFYGALSVHLGAYLLLRMSPMLELSPWLCALMVAMGLTTALFAYLTGSVQTDIKSALSYASLSQVGIIVAEIGLGFRYVALVHLLGHACLRTLQFIRAPTLLRDYNMLENAIGERLPRAGSPWVRLAADRSRDWLYRLALERGYLDAFLVGYIVTPFLRVLNTCDALERRWTNFLSGGESRESDLVKPHFGTIDEIS